MKIQHFSLTRILLLLIGLWPYQRTIFAQLQSILLLVIQVSYIILQFSVFFTSQYTMDLFLKSIFSILFYITLMMMHFSFFVNTEIVKSLLDRIQYSYDELKDEKEIAIIDKYWIKTKYYSTIFIILGTCGVLSIILLQFSPRILDIILPINKTRPLQQIQILSEYMDPGKYLYLIMLHTNVTICIGLLALIGTGTVLLGYYYHICGMFRIASYRIQQAMEIIILQSAYSKKTENVDYKGIVCAVDIHRKAIQLSEYFLSKFMIWFAALIIFGVLSMSLNLFHIFRTINEYNFKQLIVYVGSLIVQYLYMFIANYGSQEVTDHHSHVFAIVYNVRWYMAPLHIQKILLFLLQRGTKPLHLIIGGLFVGSLEGFSTLLSATISYFTVICSTGQTDKK